MSAGHGPTSSTLLGETGVRWPNSVESKAVRRGWDLSFRAKSVSASSSSIDHSIFVPARTTPRNRQQVLSHNLVHALRHADHLNTGVYHLAEGRNRTRSYERVFDLVQDCDRHRYLAVQARLVQASCASPAP